MAKVRKDTDRFARPPWGRMMRIHDTIRAGGFPNSSSLAREISVCARTIKRDVDFMRDQLRLPIEYDELRYGYYYSKPVVEFPMVQITEAEMFALLVAQKAIAQYHGTPFKEPLEAAFHRLTGELDNQPKFSMGGMDAALSFRPFAPEDTDLKVFEVLTRGLLEQRMVTFDYKNLGARTSQRRRVHPYHLACIENQWYLFAHDVDRKAIRTFVLTRLSTPELTGKRFKPSKDFRLDEYLEGSFSVFKGKEDYEVVVEFDAWATDLVRGRKWHASQELTELPNGGSRMRMRLNNIEEIERWVLNWGTHATVVRPEVLRERVREAARTLLERYK